MSELNEMQRRIAETHHGMIVVDAGPGTGKTHTIVERYVNMLGIEDVTPKDILMMTFTNNAAAEMEERIKKKMIERDMLSESKLVQVKTFDAFCLSVVMESPDDTGKLFGIEERPTHSVSLVTNDTLNVAYFEAFLDEFLQEYGADYGDWGAIGSQTSKDLFSLINRLMARGIFPLKGNGWFGGDDGRELIGDSEALFARLDELNFTEKNKSELIKGFEEHLDPKEYDRLPYQKSRDVKSIADAIIEDAVEESRSDMIRFIHDVFWHYIRKSISDDRLTFGINAMLAFSVLYTNKTVRESNRRRFVMIDEFQDTNASQLMIALMILSEPNLCVVGDWKQGIYGFRYVSIDNIIDFENRAIQLRRELNEDVNRVCFSIPEVQSIALEINYRSSQRIVDLAMKTLSLKGADKEDYDYKEIESKVVELDAELDPIMEGHTSVRFVQTSQKEDETSEVVRCIKDYIGSGNYKVLSGKEYRDMRFGDIAVLCRTGKQCRAVVERLQDKGIPAFLYGDVEIMATREGKLVLAWLKYINNEQDPWGLVPIMADLDYTMADIEVAVSTRTAPKNIHDQRRNLYARRRRVTDLVASIFGFYGLDNNITQAIINVLSEAHRGSLLTISDLINVIESDIEEMSTYNVEVDIQSDAVTVMTMHGSKGLEYPAVIIPFVDQGSMPSRQQSRSKFLFDPLYGLRCTQTIGRFGDYEKICKSWRTKLVKLAKPKEYDEERRLMFVAMSRAKQYETLICSDPSSFMKGLKDEYVTIDSYEIPESAIRREKLMPKPDVTGYIPRRRALGVHSIMSLEFGEDSGDSAEATEVCGKGKAYGDSVHQEAMNMHQGLESSGRYPESEYIRKVLDRRGLDGFLQSYTEMGCSYPVPNGPVLRGYIDLMLVFEDRIEIHDYKTDVTDRFEPEYRLQLSIYAQAAKGSYKLPVRCYIDYVSQDRTVEFDPMTPEEIGAIVIPRAEALELPNL